MVFESQMDGGLSSSLHPNIPGRHLVSLASFLVGELAATPFMILVGDLSLSLLPRVG